MEYHWELGPGGSESAVIFDLGLPLRDHLKVMKVKNSRIVLTIAHLIKVHFDL
jgi:hypothetical protein